MWSSTDINKPNSSKEEVSTTEIMQKNLGATSATEKKEKVDEDNKTATQKLDSGNKVTDPLSIKNKFSTFLGSKITNFFGDKKEKDTNVNKLEKEEIDSPHTYDLTEEDMNPAFLRKLNKEEVKLLKEKFAEALHHVAYGNLDEAKEIIKSHPEMVLLRGTTITRAGLKVINNTLLECALGGADPEMAKMIISYFCYIENGEEHKNKQLERYIPFIVGMLRQKPYDMKSLIKIIELSDNIDISKALQNDKTHQSKLNETLIKFRNEVKPTQVTIGMHYNYNTFFNNDLMMYYWQLCASCDVERKLLICKLVIGYLERGLPVIHRYNLAQGSYYGKNLFNVRSLKFKSVSLPTYFPDTPDPSDETGLGFDAYASCDGCYFQNSAENIGHYWGWFFGIQNDAKFQKDKLLALMPPKKENTNVNEHKQNLDTCFSTTEAMLKNLTSTSTTEKKANIEENKTATSSTLFSNEIPESTSIKDKASTQILKIESDDNEASDENNRRFSH